jgi:hypothetical protein
VGQLRRQRDHFGHQVSQPVLIEAHGRERGEEDRVSPGIEEPLEIGEERMRVAADGGVGQVE